MLLTGSLSSLYIVNLVHRMIFLHPLHIDLFRVLGENYNWNVSTSDEAQLDSMPGWGELVLGIL